MSHCKVTPRSLVGRTGANFPCSPVRVLFRGQNNVRQALNMWQRALYFLIIVTVFTAFSTYISLI